MIMGWMILLGFGFLRCWGLRVLGKEGRGGQLLRRLMAGRAVLIISAVAVKRTEAKWKGVVVIGLEGWGRGEVKRTTTPLAASAVRCKHNQIASAATPISPVAVRQR